MEKLPNNLRNIRKKHQNHELRSGEKVAELMGISKQYYYDLETGRNNCRLNADHLNALTKIFNVTSDELLAEVVTTDESETLKETVTRFASKKENESYILITKKAKEKGISADTLEKLVDLWRSK